MKIITSIVAVVTLAAFFALELVDIVLRGRKAGGVDELDASGDFDSDN